MQTLGRLCFQNRAVTELLVVVICCGLAGISPAVIGQETTETSLPELRHDLEGMAFSGSVTIGDETETSDGDVMTFADGKFTSRLCRQHGFAPAPYWVRRDDDGIHFRVELRSVEHGALRFKGVFDGKVMQADALWTKERWYWTVEQTMQFTGHPVEQAE